MNRIKFAGAIICFLATTAAIAQNSAAVSSYNEGKALSDKGNYSQAIPYFEKAIKNAPDYADAWNQLGTAYYYSDQYQEAIDAFKELQRVNPNYWAWFYYLSGEAYRKLGRPDEAIASFETFMKKYSDAPDREIFHHQAMFKIAYVKGAEELKNQESNMPDPVNLGSAVNSNSEDYAPQVDPTGKRLYFTSQRKGGFDTPNKEDVHKFGEDVYYCERNGGQWGKPQLLPEPINSYNNDFGSTFSGDGQTMIYVKCGTKEGIGSCDLYIAQLEGDKWSEPVNMGNVVNSKEWDSQPSISADGTKIVFSSERGGGYGGADLYLVERNRFGDWGVPSNLGPVINTPWTEKSPYIAPDGKTLYFSSYGHPGFGEADLFKSTFENNKWSTPVNLGRPLNSEGNDNYFTISASGEHAYFASSREGGHGYYDLYEIEIPDELRPQPTVIVSGIVSNSKTKEPMGAWVLVEDLVSGELIATNKSNSKTGEYLVVLPAGRNYSVSANKEAFFFYSQSFNVPNDAQYQEVVKDIALEPIEKGTRVVLNNIFFETGKAELKPESYLELSKAVALMKTNKSMVIEVGGHTDNVGSDETNMALSHERAKTVREFLVKAGIGSERVQAKGYGETQPVADNETVDGRQANRRTEFIILEN